MPVNADNSPNILWPLPEGKPAQLIRNIFSTEILEEIRASVKSEANWGPESNPSLPGAPHYCTIAGRWAAEFPISKNIWDYLESRAKTLWEVDNIKLKNVWFARYQKYKGATPYLWEHMDQPGTQYTMDVCIESPGVTWGITVDGETYEESENSGLLFMGQQQAHSRPPYPTEDKDAYVVVMFALFVDSSHWMYDIDLYDPDQYEAWETSMNKYKIDGDIRYYEHSGHAATFSNLPEGNRRCPWGKCHQCQLVDEDFIEKIEGYVRVKP